MANLTRASYKAKQFCVLGGPVPGLLIKLFYFTNVVNGLHYYPLSNFTEGVNGLADMKPGVTCPSDFLTCVGSNVFGGKWTCGMSLLAQLPYCVVYSFGVGEDSSFEAGILDTAPNCQVFAYDPTVSRIGSPLTHSTDSRVHFRKVGIAGQNAVRRKMVFHTLKTLMQENGDHRWIDILKMDVEGDEFGSLSRILEDWLPPQELPFGQLNVKIHHWAATESQIKQVLEQLEERNLRVFKVAGNSNQLRMDCCAEFSFINVKLLDKIWHLSQEKPN